MLRGGLALKITVHRGTEQIGGCVTEIATDQTRIILDFGTELPDATGQTPPNTLLIDGVNFGKPACDAVLFSHYHADHTGLLDTILPGIPIIMGTVSKDILLALYRLVRKDSVSKVEEAIAVPALKPFTIGDLQITRIPVDHSAYDAAMFLVNNGEQKVLFTGDFRFHGFRGKASDTIVQKYVGGVDVLITEGTLLSRLNVPVLSEFDIQELIKAVVKKYKYVFALCSSTNVDRLGIFHNNTPPKRYFVCDRYQKEIFDIIADASPSDYYKFRKALTYGSNLDLRLKQKGFVMLVRKGSMLKEFMRQYENDNQAVLIYSMWNGYLDGRDQELSRLVKPFQASGRFEMLHTSGHAPLDDILKLISWTNPKTIIPVHTEAGEVLAKGNMRENVVLLDDGESFLV